MYVKFSEENLTIFSSVLIATLIEEFVLNVSSSSVCTFRGIGSVNEGPTNLSEIAVVISLMLGFCLSPS